MGNLRIRYDVLMDNALNDSDSDDGRRFYRAQLAGFILACQCIDNEESRNIIKDYEDFKKQNR